MTVGACVVSCRLLPAAFRLLLTPMGYSIHIERDPPLTLAEWTAAVDQTTEVRLDTRGCSATNPKTGEVVSIAGSDGDAEVSIEGTWYPCFHWSDGSVSFRASSDFHEP